MTVRTKIETRLDALEEALQAGEHLKSAEGVLYTLILIQHGKQVLARTDGRRTGLCERSKVCC